MPKITDADRKAAEELRVLLADLSGFWFRPGDDGPLVMALARHRMEAERLAAEKRKPFEKERPRCDATYLAPALERSMPLPALGGNDLGPIAA